MKIESSALLDILHAKSREAYTGRHNMMENDEYRDWCAAQENAFADIIIEIHRLEKE